VNEVPVGASRGVQDPERVAASSSDAHLRGLRQLLVALGTALSTPVGDEDLEATFEQQVRQALDLRSVRLREVRARYQARLVTPTRTTDSIVLGVPTSDTRVQAVLEACCDPTRRFDEHDLDALTAVAQLGGLVLEVARGRVASRVRPAATVAPLIGTTPVMEALRARVERVAATDFTVLIEGSIDHEHQTTLSSGRSRHKRASTAVHRPLRCGPAQR
jgi:hypothetical protein